jgi:hypothetical protein
MPESKNNFGLYCKLDYIYNVNLKFKHMTPEERQLLPQESLALSAEAISRT